jgi:trehalose/maltose hydrolase-like predicted phosphorylase
MLPINPYGCVVCFATQPDIAQGMDTYRHQRLAAAEANARATC